MGRQDPPVPAATCPPARVTRPPTPPAQRVNWDHWAASPRGKRAQTSSIWQAEYGSLISQCCFNPSCCYNSTNINPLRSAGCNPEQETCRQKMKKRHTCMKAWSNSRALLKFFIQNTLSSFCIRFYKLNEAKPWAQQNADFTHQNRSSRCSISCSYTHGDKDNTYACTLFPHPKKGENHKISFLNALQPALRHTDVCLKTKLNLAIKGVNLITGLSTVPQEVKPLKNNRRYYHTSDLQHRHTISERLYSL